MMGGCDRVFDTRPLRRALPAKEVRAWPSRCLAGLPWAAVIGFKRSSSGMTSLPVNGAVPGAAARLGESVRAPWDGAGSGPPTSTRRRTSLVQVGTLGHTHSHTFKPFPTPEICESRVPG